MVNGRSVKAQVDSGAVVTVVPASLVPWDAFTGKTWRAQGLTGGETLPIAEVNIGVSDTSARMRVEGQKDVILGTDFPEFKKLLEESGHSFQPTD